MKKLILIMLSLALLISFAACDKNSAADHSGYQITVAKTSDSMDAGTALSAEDVSSLMAKIEAAEKENGWMKDTVSNSIASCYFSVENAGEKTLYKYCKDGVLDDLTNMRSLTLGDNNAAISELLSSYVELGYQLAALPELGEIQLNP